MAKRKIGKRRRWQVRVRRTVHGYLRKLVGDAVKRGEIRSAEDRVYWQDLIHRRNRHGEITNEQAQALLNRLNS